MYPSGPGQPSKQNLWVALIQDFPPYQTVHASEITPNSYQIVTDEYGNRYAEFDLADMPPGATTPIEIRYRVAVNELAYNLDPCEGKLPDLFNEAELHIESNNPQIVELARTEKPDVVLISGDLYDRAVPPVEAVDLLDDTLARLALGGTRR